MYKPRFSPKIILLITLIAIVTVVAAAIIITNAVVQNWGMYEIFTAIGSTFLILGGLGMVMSYNAGTRAGGSYASVVYTDMAVVEGEYARERRTKIPWISILLIVIAAIFLGIGLANVL